jgi:hypothetical protein
MQVFFCTGCSAGLVFGRRRCLRCGLRVGPGQTPPPLPRSWPARLAGISAFFESQASLSLVTLLMLQGLAIALAPAGWRYWQLQTGQLHNGAPSSPAVSARVELLDLASMPPARSGRCQTLRVFFSDGATPGEVSALLGRLGAARIRGAGRQGGYELAVPEQTALAVAESLDQARGTVDGFFFKPRCGLS